MTGKTHMLFGAALSLYILPKLGIEANLVTAAIASAGALIPDIDHPGSKINQIMLPMKNRLGKMIIYSGLGGVLLYKANNLDSTLTFLGLILIVIGLSHHRSFTHSIPGAASLSLVSFMFFKNYLSNNLIYAFIIGILSHLIGDFFTKQGIELFYPISEKNYRLPINISSGGIFKYIISFILVFAIMKSIF